jgi:hypothetical protein
LVKVSWRGCKVSPKAEERKTEKESKSERERKEERERKGEVLPKWVPKCRHPRPGSPSKENAQPVSQVSP